MLDIFLNILPIIVLFILGVSLRRLAVLGPKHGNLLLKTVVYIGLPALILASFTTIELTAEMAFLPLCAALTIILTWPVAVLTGRRLGLPRATLGVYIIAPMIMNMAFEYPFIVAAYGQEGFAHLALFDFGNGAIVLTLVYALACWYGGEGGKINTLIKEVVTFPPFVALLLALIVNYAHIAIAPHVIDVVERAGQLTILLVPLALGIHFNVSKIRHRVLVFALLLRSGLGLALGICWVTVFNLDGISRVVVMFGAIAPVGFNTIVFAARERLDSTFAASLASISMALALVYLPVALVLLR